MLQSCFIQQKMSSNNLTKLVSIKRIFSEVWTELNEFHICSSKELELSALEIHSTEFELVYIWQVDCDLDKL